MRRQVTTPKLVFLRRFRTRKLVQRAASFSPSLIAMLCCCLGVVTIGCANLRVESQDLELSDWTRGRVPGTIGVHYTDELRSYVVSDLGDDFLLGESTVDVFDFQLERVFERRVDLEGRPGPASPAVAVDAALSIDVSAAVFHFGNCTPANRDVFKVAYELTLLSPEGETWRSWRMTGIGSHFCGGKLDVRWPRAREAMRLALQDAAENLAREVVAEFEARTGGESGSGER